MTKCTFMTEITFWLLHQSELKLNTMNQVQIGETVLEHATCNFKAFPQSETQI